MAVGDMPCRDCGGKRTVKVGRQDDQGNLVTVEITCKACKGTGKR